MEESPTQGQRGSQGPSSIIRGIVHRNQLVYDACSPTRQPLPRKDGDKAISKILENDDENFGNARSGEYVDMIESGTGSRQGDQERPRVSRFHRRTGADIETLIADDPELKEAPQRCPTWAAEWVNG